MAGYNLPEGGLVADHKNVHHPAVHDIINKFDKDASPAEKNVLAWDNATALYLPKVLLEILPAGTTITLTKSGGTWPNAPTTRTDIVIQWKGPDPSPAIVASRSLGSAGMLDNVDIRLITT